jgi:outer membrane lipoprotein-sorting protein
MKKTRQAFRLTAFLLPLMLTGCLWRTRKLPIPKAPENIITVPPDQLVAQINDRWDKLHTLQATVDIQASLENANQGTARDYTSFPGFIILRKPGMLRVLGLLPVIRSTMFDMATDGKAFQLYIPSKSKVIKGSNTVKKKSANKLENMRPDFFYDAMVVRGLELDDLYTVTADTETVEDVSKKHLLMTPEYVLNITRSKPNSRELIPVRVITLSRVDLMPYQQDLYDEQGNLATHVTYSNYQDFGFGPYPGTITIKRPLEDVQLVLTIQKVTQNQTVDETQFAVHPKEGTQVQSLE